MTKKVFAFLSVVLAASMLLTACGGGTTVQPTPTTQAAQAQPAFLTLNTEQQATWVRNFNPFSPDARGVTGTAMYEPMMIFNRATAEIVPWLATGYTWNSDNTVLTFKIRDGVKWSDGQPFSANDVLYTFNLLKGNAALAGTASSILNEYIDSFSAPDATTVEFKFKVVYTPALYDLADQLIVPEHIWKDVQDPVTWTNDNPVATGPFTQVTRFDAQIYIVEKNPNYWQPGKPYFQGLRFPAYPGNDQANMALANGELDWAGNFVPDIQNTYVSKDPEHFKYYFVGTDAVMLYLNPSLKPFDKPEVRKAISMGIDRKKIVNIAEYDYIPPSDATGIGDAYKSWKNPDAVAAGTWGNFDVAKANAELDAAGLKKGADGIRLDQDGKPMKYDLIVVSGWTDWISACQIIAQNMGDLGIEINVQTPEYDAWYDEISKGQFQWAIGWSDGGATPYNFYRGQMSKITLQPVGESASSNWGRFDNPQVDTLLEEFAKTSDAAKQKSIMDQIQMLFVNDAPALPLFPGPDWYEYNTTRFTGFPTQDNPYAPGPPYQSPGGYASPLFIFTTVKPVQ